ncbi:hybrid sensor histidine kinase/response regulator [Halostella sp. JP-L12]|uniref:sensor histidine kinase n=1 Tax=Halostella TaxID=1843185 RepID=UPI000EF81699|nr:MULTISPECIES: HAMP domain-containing sensor histidine kinase [Halostella]NHN46999.1 hybrid sensor histidine kinase/response regulator [Halostella sp. JP-L12]
MTALPAFARSNGHVVCVAPGGAPTDDLSAAGWSVTTRSDAESALDALDAADCVVTGHDPPALDAAALLERIRDAGYDGPILVYAADIADETVERVLAAGGDFLPAGGDTGDRSLLRERVRTIVDARRTRAALRREADLLERVASVVSHDFRNPIGLAQGHLGMVRERTDHDSLDQIDYAIDRIADLTDGVPALARNGSVVTEPEPVDLTAIAECSAAAVADRPVDVRVDEALPTVSGVVSRVATLFETLYANAAEHGIADGAGTGESLTVRIEPTEDGFRVADDGVGIPERERDAVFDWGVSTVDDRLGVGLAVVDAIAEAHGWTATVAEGSDGGARFEFAFGGPPTV